MGKMKDLKMARNATPALPDEISPDALAAAVHFHRKKGRLTQAELAKLAGVGKTVVFDIEKGKATIQLNTLLKVLHVLNISMSFTSPLMSAFLGAEAKRTDEKS